MQAPASAVTKLVPVKDVSSTALRTPVLMAKEKTERKASSVAHTNARTKTVILPTILVKSQNSFTKDT